MVPSSTWATNSLTRFLPRSRAAGSLRQAAFLDDLVEQARSPTVCSAAGAAAAGFLWVSSFGPPSGFADLGLQLVQLLGVADGVEQQLFQLVVALQAAAQVGELGAQIQQLPQRLDLPGHLLRLEIVQALEVQIDLQLAGVGIVAQLVLHREGEVRLHALQNGVEVVRIHLHELPILQPRQRLSGWPVKSPRTPITKGSSFISIASPISTS